MKATTFFSLAGHLVLAMAYGNTSVGETTTCLTTTILTTTTVTVTNHPGTPSSSLVSTSSSSLVSTSSIPSVGSSWLSSAEPVKPTSAPTPIGPNVTTIHTTLTDIKTSVSAWYPTINGTSSATASVTAPHSSGTGVAPGSSTSAVPPEFTSGNIKMTADGLVVGLMAIGAVFVSL